MTDKLDRFLAGNNFARLYKSYKWENDTYEANDGFSDILDLEFQLSGKASSVSSNDESECITLDDIKSVARWGKNTRNISRIRSTECPIPGDELYSPVDGCTSESLEDEPLSPIRILQDNTQQVGPTYLSKVLRFALPSQFGAIDTQQVRVFGKGDSKFDECELLKWLELRVNNPKNWAIPKNQKHWPDGYGIWINILRYFAQKLNSDKELSVKCPHPKQFVDAGLRGDGIWTCADVEMALFAYASGLIDECDGC